MFGRDAFQARIEDLERQLHASRELAEQWRACYYEEKNRADRYMMEALELAKAFRPTPQQLTAAFTMPDVSRETSPQTTEEAKAATAVEPHFTDEIQRAIALRADDFNAVRELTEWAERQRMAGVSPDEIAYTIEHGIMVEPDDDGSYEDYA